ncbi:MAG: GNAT family N-acetyltransferase [Flavobacteriales bacterium]|nr:GNAT family N-acetyltransferase [Flavobacteriales bacterium]
MEDIIWEVKAFYELSVEEFFEIIYLRTAVFVVEQNCAYQEVDVKDKQAFHLFGRTESGEVIAITRVLPKGISYDDISIGRVVLKKEFRGKGIADVLLQKTLDFVAQEFGRQSIRISAQTYLINYYQKHSFIPVGEEYLEDDLPHIEMLLEIRDV